jgi:anti-sigma-K factor RskA
MSVRDELGLLTGAYALDALHDDERAALEAALTESPELRSEVDSLHETALALAYAATPVEPSADLKASLMAKIQSTPQVAADDASVADGESVLVADVPAPVGLEARPASARHVAPAAGPAEQSARRRWFQRPAAVLGAAAAAVAVVVTASFGVNSFTNPSPGVTQAAPSSSLDRIYAAADFKRSSTDVRGGGTATVVWSDELGKSAVIFDGLKAAPDGKTYELWYIGSKDRGGTISSAGLVNDVDGGVRSAVLSGSKEQGDTIGVTVEPAGGSKQPTTTPIAAVPTA